MKKLLIGAGLLVVLACPAYAQAVPPRTVTVSGEGSAEFVPDQAVLSISLVNKDKDIAVAKKANDARLETLLAILRKLEIPKEKLVTSNLNVAPEYRYDNTKNEQQFTGYAITRSLRVKLPASDMPEKLLSALIGAGIDQVGNIEFMLSDPEASAAPLRIKAFENAKARAQALAEASGSKLGAALMIATADMPAIGPRPPMPMMAMAKASSAMAVAPSVPGQVELHESVTVTFALE